MNIVYYVDYEDSRWYAPNRHSRRYFNNEIDAVYFKNHKLLIERRMATLSEVKYLKPYVPVPK
jgi:hypothetical protein